MQLSGGSTGLSKLIPADARRLHLLAARERARSASSDADSVYLGALPIAHNYPMSSPGVLGALYAGATVALSPSPSPDVAFPIIERERVTITGVVPPVALIWLEAAATTACDLSSLEVLQVGGAKLTTEVARRVTPDAERHAAAGLRHGRGAGELHAAERSAKTSSSHTQGRPISPDDEILIVDDEDRPSPAGDAGHLLTRGPYTIRAYHNAPDVNARAFTADGYYRTGDIVSLTPDGYLVVQGRANDHINRGGEKVSAEEIEEHLLAHPTVHDAAVVVDSRSVSRRAGLRVRHRRGARRRRRGAEGVDPLARAGGVQGSRPGRLRRCVSRRRASARSAARNCGRHCASDSTGRRADRRTRDELDEPGLPTIARTPCRRAMNFRQRA